MTPADLARVRDPNTIDQRPEGALTLAELARVRLRYGSQRTVEAVARLVGCLGTQQLAADLLALFRHIEALEDERTRAWWTVRQQYDRLYLKLEQIRATPGITGGRIAEILDA